MAQKNFDAFVTLDRNLSLQQPIAGFSIAVVILRARTNRLGAFYIYDKDEKVIRRGRFKGKKVTFASQERIEEFAELANEFMERIFDLGPGEYLITDESDVRDFTEIGSSDTSAVWKRIDDAYGIVSADVQSARLVDILGEITRRMNRQ